MSPDQHRWPLASGLLAGQGVGLLALGGWLASRVPGRDIHNHGLLGALAVITAASGVLVWFGARGVARGAQWPRVPSMLLQVFGVVVATGLLQAGRYLYGGGLLALALATAGSLLRVRRQRR